MKRAAVLVVLLASSRAQALDPPFGARGQTVITENAIANVSYSFKDSGASSLVANLYPSADYFVIRDLAIGLDAGVTYQRTHALTQSGFVDSENERTSAGLRVAPNVSFGRWVSFWPRATVQFNWSQSPGVVTTTFAGAELTLYLPLLLHIRSHWFVGFGPEISHRWDYSLGPAFPTLELTTASMHTMIGGYLGGEKDPNDDEVPIHWRPFGERREMVIDAGASFTWEGNPQRTFTSWAAGARVGIGYFVIDHLSVGLSVTGSYSRTDDTGLPSSEFGYVSVAPSAGYDVPISSRFSFYPRVWLGFGAQASTAATTALVYVTAYAPLLFHVAPHFFMGFGPTFTRELVDDTGLGTNVGAALTVGGWL